MVGEMWNRSGHTVRRCSLTSVLLASLALLPSFAWAAREDPKADRGEHRQQTQAQHAARGQQTPAQPPAAGRANASQRRASGNLLVAPAAAAPTVRINKGNTAARIPSQPRGASRLARARCRAPTPTRTTASRTSAPQRRKLARPTGASPRRSSGRAVAPASPPSRRPNLATSPRRPAPILMGFAGRPRE